MTSSGKATVASTYDAVSISGNAKPSPDHDLRKQRPACRVVKNHRLPTNLNMAMPKLLCGDVVLAKKRHVRSQ